MKKKKMTALRTILTAIACLALATLIWLLVSYANGVAEGMYL